jgi:hypothetical protein
MNGESLFHAPCAGSKGIALGPMNLGTLLGFTVFTSPIVKIGTVSIASRGPGHSGKTMFL